jgi:hypothetical protein
MRRGKKILLSVLLPRRLRVMPTPEASGSQQKRRPVGRLSPLRTKGVRSSNFLPLVVLILRCGGFMATVLLRMEFCRLCGVMSRMLKMSMGAVGVVGSFFVIASFGVFRCFFVVLSGALVVLRGIVVMRCCFFRHLDLLDYWFVSWATLDRKVCRLGNMGHFAGGPAEKSKITLECCHA